MAIADFTVQKIKETTDIIEVVADYLPLKKRGQNWWALSPFTDEKTPSFTVSPDKGIFKCFSSGKGGDAISFVMEMESMNYVEALKHLAQKYAIELEEDTHQKHSEGTERKESVMIALNFAKVYYCHNLWHAPEGLSIGMAYLKERGIQEKTIKHFGIGYSFNSWDAFLKAAEKEQYTIEILEQAGLVLSKENRSYDRFRERIIFPIHNAWGKVIGFGARALKKSEQAKYINSPESEVYHKSNVLYGIFQAKNAIRQKNNCYLVEGYTDVIALHQAGIENVVGSSGTALTAQQIKLVQRFTKHITVLYDGDPAGIKASLRGIDLILEKGLDVKIALLPEGEDPDSYIQKVGGPAFQDFLNKSTTDFILFKTKLFLDETKSDPVKKASIIRDIVTSIVKVPDAIKRALFYKSCSTLLALDEEILIDEGNKIVLKQKKQTFTKPTEQEIQEQQRTSKQILEEKPSIVDPVSYQERESIRILLEYGNECIAEGVKLHQHLFDELENITFQTHVYKRILEVYQREISQGNEIDHNYFIEHADDSLKQVVIDLMTESWCLSENWHKKHKIFIPEKDENLSSVVYTNLLRLKFRVLKKLCKESIEMMKMAKTAEEVDEAQLIYMELKNQENMLAKSLGIVVS